MTGRRRITVSIDRLVVDGPADAAAVRQAVTHELQARLAAQAPGDLQGGNRAQVRVNAGPEAATPEGAAAAIGRALGPEGGR